MKSYCLRQIEGKLNLFQEVERIIEMKRRNPKTGRVTIRKRDGFYLCCMWKKKISGLLRETKKPTCEGGRWNSHSLSID